MVAKLCECIFLKPLSGILEMDEFYFEPRFFPPSVSCQSFHSQRQASDELSFVILSHTSEWHPEAVFLPLLNSRGRPGLVLQ